MVLGIDIGGTNIKCGLVSSDGYATKQQVISTREWIDSGDFVKNLLILIKSYEKEKIIGCGIAIPATINLSDGSILFIPAIPCLQGLCLKDLIQKEFPYLLIIVENDSNAAAFGEYQLRADIIHNGMLLITLGTGVGCGLILGNSIFKGGNGNALELGEILSDKNERLEDMIGVKGIERMANPEDTESWLTVPDIIRNANMNDPQAVNIMQITGQKLGRAIIHAGWLLDVWNIVLGGGVSEAFISIKKGMDTVFQETLPDNIRNIIRIEKAVLGNNAGLIGVALCCFAGLEKIKLK